MKSLILFLIISLIGSSLSADSFKVKSVNGKVHIRSSEDLQVRSLLQGETLRKEDRIRLSKHAEVIIETNQGSLIHLTEEGYVRIASLLGDEKQMNFKMQLFKGKAKSNVKQLKQGEDFQIHTPTIKVKVRGTLFETITNSLVNSNVDVNHGSVGVGDGRGSNRILNQGQKGSSNDNTITNQGSNNKNENPNGNKSLKKTENLQQEQSQQNQAERLFNLKIKVRDRDR